MYRKPDLSHDNEIVFQLIKEIEAHRWRAARRLAVRIRHHALREAWLEEIAEGSASAMQCAA